MGPPDIKFSSDFSMRGLGFRVHAPQNDWFVVQTARPNLLLSGPREATQACLLALTPELQQPVHDGPASDAFLTTPAGGTLVLRDVDGFDLDRQQKLLRWLDSHNGRTQVISLTTVPLYAQVQAGLFLSQLYYRLNVVYFKVTQDDAGEDGSQQR